jgi:hypothetical protein
MDGAERCAPKKPRLDAEKSWSMRYNCGFGIQSEMCQKADFVKEARRAVVVVNISAGMGKSIRAEKIIRAKRVRSSCLRGFFAFPDTDMARAESGRAPQAERLNGLGCDWQDSKLNEQRDSKI